MAGVIETAVDEIVHLFDDRWSITQQDGWDEFGGEARTELHLIVQRAITEHSRHIANIVAFAAQEARGR